MYLSRFILVTALLACAAGHQAAAQQPAEKEIKLGTNAFTIGDPVPSWVDRAALPEVTKTLPIVVRLADGQYLVDRVPVVYVRRATQINNAAALTAAGECRFHSRPNMSTSSFMRFELSGGRNSSTARRPPTFDSFSENKVWITASTVAA